MSKTIYVNNEQQEAILSAVKHEMERVTVDKAPKDINIKYLGALMAVRDKLNNKEEVGC